MSSITNFKNEMPRKLSNDLRHRKLQNILEKFQIRFGT